MSDVAPVVQRGIQEACRKAYAQNPSACFETVQSNLRFQVFDACEYSAKQKPEAKIDIGRCAASVFSSLWLNIDTLRKRLPPSLKFVADNILKTQPLWAMDRTTHRSLITFIQKESEIYARDEAIPPEARCMDYYEWRIFNRLNHDRAPYAPPLRPDCNLVRAARAHSEDLGKNMPQWDNTDPVKGDNPHRSSNGQSGIERIWVAAPRFGAIAENTWRSGRMHNLATSDQCQFFFMHSPGHRKNVLNPALTHVGIGLYTRPEDGQVFVTQDFGGLPKSDGALKQTGSR